MKHILKINSKSKTGKRLAQRDEEVPFDEFAIELKKSIVKRFQKQKAPKSGLRT